jgi:hypothetical protein
LFQLSLKERVKWEAVDAEKAVLRIIAAKSAIFVLLNIFVSPG